MTDDTIYRQAAIEVPERFIKDCNPEHFVGHQKFIEYMDDAEIGSFGNWQFANGFNMGLTAAEVSIAKLPSAQRKGKWIYLNGLDAFECSVCGRQMVRNIFDYCPWCGAEMTKGEIRACYNCFDENEREKYEALSEAIRKLKPREYAKNLEGLKEKTNDK